MEIKKPIIIISSGRGGSSIFYKILSGHPKVAFLNRFSEEYPDKISRSRLFMKLIDIPVFGKVLNGKTTPVEGYLLLEKHIKGYSRPCRDLTKNDVTINAKTKFHEVLSQLLTSRRNRLLLKVTGWPRIGYLQDNFNDAFFIHVNRDPRAVVNSFLNIDFWKGWQGPSNWRWGPLSNEHQKLWEKYDKSFVALAAIQMKIYYSALNESKKSAKKYIEIHYEDLCENPEASFKKVIRFCELAWSNDFEKLLKQFKLRNTNYKWKQELTNQQQDILNDVLKEELKENNYI